MKQPASLLVQRRLGRHGHRVFHPLVGADLLTLMRIVRRGSRPTPSGAVRLALAALTATARSPLDLVDRLRSPAVAPVPDIAPPVLIVGHWRSGTTHLLNVLGRSPALATLPPLAAALPRTFLGLGGFLRRRLEECLPPDRIIDGMPVTATSPQEDELALANMQALSFYHGIFFPRRIEHEFRRGLFFDGCSEAEIARWRHTVAKLAVRLQHTAPGRTLLLKNPAHSGRLDETLKVFPQARLIRVQRNPYVVIESTRRMLATLLSEFALERSHDVDLGRLVLDTYARMTSETERVLSRLPTGRVARLRFEDFEAAPITELGRLHAELDLPGFEAALPHFRHGLDRASGYRKRRHTFDPSMIRAIHSTLGPLLDRLGYLPPEPLHG